MIKLRTTHYALRTTKQGFTIIELVMTIVILGILAGVGVPLGLKVIDSFQYNIFRKDLSESADVVLRRMSREIRRLKDDEGVFTANATAYSFMDKDDKTITFQVNGTDLERIRVDDAETDVLATNVSSFSFSYLDDAGASIPSPLVNPQKTDIKLIDINLTFESDNNTINYQTQVLPRNVTHIADLFS